MYWEEEHDDNKQQVPDDVIDLAFSVSCRCLPVDHAYELAQAVMQHLPWLEDEAQAGIHPIHVADSGNGWMRPENPDDLLHLSRRTKLVLRVPKHRIDDAKSLVGKPLAVAGNEMAILKVEERTLSPITTIFSRYIVSQGEEDEEAFLQLVYEQLQAMGIKPPKMLPGRQHELRSPQGNINTRSLMLAGLSHDESVKIQQQGVGPYRHLGCGLFIPHKDIKEIRHEQG